MRTLLPPEDAIKATKIGTRQLKKRRGRGSSESIYCCGLKANPFDPLRYTDAW